MHRRILACLMLAPLLTHAQTRTPTRTPTRAPAEAATSSIWYAVSLGGAGTRLTCDACQTSRDVGTILSVAAGGYKNSRLRLGIEASRWTYDEQGTDERVHTFGVIAHLLPDPRRGVFLIGGVGWSGYRAGDFSYDAPRLTVGAGWSFPVRSGWTAAGTLSLDAASFAAIKNAGTTVQRDVGLSSVKLALQVIRR